MTGTATGVELAATDSYRLAARTIECGPILAEGERALIPASAFTEVAKLLAASDKISVRIDERSATFANSTVSLTTSLVRSEHPAYKSVIPARTDGAAIIGRTDLIAALKRAQLVTQKSPVKVTFGTAARIGDN
jgi:DNA polymerase III sliding clamp (beta) subunit (PCNA family)